MPIPKKVQPVELNDYRPVALTPIVMKCLGRIVLSRLLPAVAPSMDDLQFAYRKKRSVEDATITVLYQHLDKRNCKKKNVSPYMCSWISDFLTERKQRVCITSHGERVVSDMLTINTGAPQNYTLKIDGLKSTKKKVEINQSNWLIYVQTRNWLNQLILDWLSFKPLKWFECN